MRKTPYSGSGGPNIMPCDSREGLWINKLIELPIKASKLRSLKFPFIQVPMMVSFQRSDLTAFEKSQNVRVGRIVMFI